MLTKKVKGLQTELTLHVCLEVYGETKIYWSDEEWWLYYMAVYVALAFIFLPCGLGPERLDLTLDSTLELQCCTFS